MKHAFFVFKVVLALCILTGSVKGDTITWASGVSGNWSNPNNWSPAEVPGPSDTAIINTFGVYTVTLDTNTSVSGLVVGADIVNGEQTLQLNGETFNINGPATVKTNGVINLGNGFLSFDLSGDSVIYGELTCSGGGTLSGFLNIASNGVVNLLGINGETTPIGLDGLSLTNCGTVVWSNIDLDCSYVEVFNYGLWDIQSDNTFYGDIYNGPSFATFNNYGTVRKDAGGFNPPNYISAFDSETTFSNFGTVDVEIGGININNGSGGGLFNTVTNAGLSLDNFTLTGDSTFTGPGAVQGTLNGNNGVIHGSLIFDYGSLSGWLTVATDGVVNLVGINGETTPIGLDGLSLTNCGTVVWSNIDLDCSYVEVFNYGLWDAQSDNTFYGDIYNGPSFATFNNYGTVRKDGGLPGQPNGSTSFDSETIFNNAGIVDAESGILGLATGSGGGIFNTASNAFVGLGLSGSFTLTGDTTFTGPGPVQGNLFGNNGIIHGSLIFDYGSLSGWLTIASNTVANLVGINVTTPISLNGLSLTNCGTIVWSNIDLDCSSAQVFNYGLWDIQSDNTFYGDIFSSPYFSTFNNYGTVRKDGGGFNPPNYISVFDSETTFSNAGTLDVEIGGININSGTGGGLFNTASGAGLSLGEFTLDSDATFTGPGAVQGTLFGFDGVIHGSLIFDYGSLSGTLTVASNGVVNLLGINGETTPIGLNGLSLTNCGTVIWSNIDLDCSSAQVFNYGLWDAQSDNTFYGDIFSSPYFSTFNNYGMVRKDGGSTITTFDNATTFNNAGTVDVEASQININSGTGGGVFNTASNAIVWLGIGNGFTLSGRTTFTGPGLVGGNLYGYPTGTIRGSLNFYYGSLGGTLTVTKNAVANLVGAMGIGSINLNGLTLTNCGTVLWSNVDLQCNSSQIYNYGLWNAPTSNIFYGDSGGGPYFSTFNNYGTFYKSGGGTTFDGATTFNNPGRTDVQSGLISLEGNYSLTNGTLNFGIGGSILNSVIGLDESTAKLAGRLSGNFLEGYSPKTGDAFRFLLYYSETGAFSSTSLPKLPAGLSWQIDSTNFCYTATITTAPLVELSSGLSLDGSSMALSWDGLLGQTYQVQCTTNLAPAIWVNLGDPIAGTNGPISVLDSISTSPNKFYRIESQ